MTPPVRPILYTITERDDIVTLRGAVDWYKHVANEASDRMGDLTGLEIKYVNGEWGRLIKELAAAQGVPVGMLSYWLNELATNEIAVEREASVALSYGEE